MKEYGGKYQRADDWQSLAITAGNLITGQNPASPAAAARAVVKLLGDDMTLASD